MDSKTKEILIRTHRRALKNHKRHRSETSLETLLDITVALNSEMVVFLGDDKYEEAIVLSPRCHCRADDICFCGKRDEGRL